MRVLFSCFPGHGHLLPLVPLARACQRAGDDVLFATGPDLCSEIERSGFAAAVTGLSLADSLASCRATFPAMGALPPDFAHLFVDVAGRARATDLVPLAADWSPDLIVHDDCEPAAAIAAAKVGAARVTHGLGIPVPADFAAAAAGSLERLHAAWGLDRDAVASLWTVPYLDIYPPRLRPALAVAATDLRPLRPESPAPATGECLPRWDDRLPHARTVYVTLGTMVNGATGIFEMALAGLRDEPLNVIVTLGPGGDPALLGPQRAGVIVERYVPQALVLARCDAVIVHGGAGTMLGALAHGLPQVLLPQGAGQFVNAAACAGAGAGIALEPGQVSPEAIRDATRRILGEPAYRERARSLAAEIAAMPSADDVLADLRREIRPVPRSR